MPIVCPQVPAEIRDELLFAAGTPRVEHAVVMIRF